MKALKSGNKFYLMLLLVGILAWNGCALIGKMSGLNQARELQRIGDPAQATVLEIWDTGITVMNDPVIGFLLEVRRQDKAPYQARTRLLISRIKLPRIQPGAVLPVRIDPGDPQRVSLDIYNFDKKRRTSR